MNYFLLIAIAILIAINICFEHVEANSSDSFGLPQPPNCGKRSSKSKRIFGGMQAHINEYPWMAILIYEDDTSSFCSGTLISEQWVLTAAHCVHNRPVANVRLGDWNIQTNPDCEDFYGNRRVCADPYVEIAVDKSIPHPDFQHNGVYPNDIALLHLAEFVNSTDWIRPICLPPARSADAIRSLGGSYRFIAGWGRYEGSGNSGSERLLKAIIEIWTGENCQEKLQRLQLNDRQFCSGGTAGSCRGDSGGPVMDLRQGIFYQDGIISWGITSCGAGNLPVIFTHVDAYINWIVEEMGKTIK